jgi:hypothetical protein
MNAIHYTSNTLDGTGCIVLSKSATGANEISHMIINYENVNRHFRDLINKTIEYDTIIITDIMGDEETMNELISAHSDIIFLLIDHHASSAFITSLDEKYDNVVAVHNDNEPSTMMLYKQLSDADDTNDKMTKYEVFAKAISEYDLDTPSELSNQIYTEYIFLKADAFVKKYVSNPTCIFSLAEVNVFKSINIIIDRMMDDITAKLYSNMIETPDGMKRMAVGFGNSYELKIADAILTNEDTKGKFAVAIIVNIAEQKIFIKTDGSVDALSLIDTDFGWGNTKTAVQVFQTDKLIPHVLNTLFGN